MTVGDLKKFLSDNPQLPDYMDVCIMKSDDEFDVGSVESIYIKKVRFSEDAYSIPGEDGLEAYDNVLILHDEYLTPEEIEEHKRESEKCQHLNIKKEDGLDECLDCGARNY